MVIFKLEIQNLGTVMRKCCSKESMQSITFYLWRITCMSSMQHLRLRRSSNCYTVQIILLSWIEGTAVDRKAYESSDSYSVNICFCDAVLWVQQLTSKYCVVLKLYLTNQEIREKTTFTFALNDLESLLFSNGEFDCMVYMSEAINLGRNYKYNPVYHDIDIDKFHMGRCLQSHRRINLRAH